MILLQMYDCFSLYTPAISTPVNGNQTICDHCLPKLHAWILVAKIIDPLLLLIECCLKIQQQLGQKTNLPCAEVIAMFTTGLH